MLILGGLRFAACHIMSGRLLEHRRQVSLVNPGRTDLNLFRQAKQLVGNRDGSLDVWVRRR